MTKRMLIDSTHAEETRVVVLDGNRLEDYDVETSTKQQLKGNIYLAKIVRVEPSLQAAFVEFGGGRHGFLAFGEIHPDYYQIPVADRKRLLELQEAEAREEEEEEEREAARRERGGPVSVAVAEPEPANDQPDEPTSAVAEMSEAGEDASGGEEAAADSATEAAYAMQADPDTAEIALPRPDQVAQAASVAQDIIIAPEEAQSLFPDAAEPTSEGADLAIEAAEPGATSEGHPPEDKEFQHDVPDATPLEAAETEAVEAEPAETAISDGGAAESDDGAADGMVAEAETIGSEQAQPDITEPAAAGGPDQTDIPAGQDAPVSATTVEVGAPSEPPESIGGELDTDDRADRRSPPRFTRNYKIQEVMRRRQILLVQVVKEERGNKGAALTTYISLAGRFSVLMPNSPRGGGISRKITSAADRRRLKEITTELDLPRGMGLIIRTAGAQRPKPEIIRDCEYLLDQWDQIRELTMKSMAPTLIYEEASLIKRAIRDVYSREIEEILVDGEDGWRAAHDFMRMLMPAHARKVQLWRDPQPLFAKAQVESQLDAMLYPTVQLRSGGYLVINQTEALVAIDVNSGRSTRERGIEETAIRTNLEAAEEAARQLRLRDLAGLIVIDFIDMESRRNNVAVEKRLKDALRNDRARIQVGSISHFGLLEMSRQRLRPSLTETSFIICSHCGGTGHMRSTESAALAVLRGIEDEGSRRRAAEIVVHVHGSIALYVLNHKRVRLSEIEQRFGMHVTFQADESMVPPAMRIEKVRALVTSEGPVPISQLPPPEPFEDLDEEVLPPDPVPVEAPPVAEAPIRDAEAAIAAPAETAEGPEAAESDDDGPDRPGETAEEGEQRRRKRRRRRRGGRREEAVVAATQPAIAAPSDEATAADTVGSEVPVQVPTLVPASGEAEDSAASSGEAVEAEPVEGAETAAGTDGERKRRGRRGGRRRRREPSAEGEPQVSGTEDVAPEPYQAPLPVAPPPPVMTYTGPTPANPFGGDSNAFAFFDAVEEVDDVPVRAPPRPPVRAPVRAEAAHETVQSTAAAPEAEVDNQPAAPETVEPAVLEGPPVEKKRGWWRR